MTKARAQKKTEAPTPTPERIQSAAKRYAARASKIPRYIKEMRAYLTDAMALDRDVFLAWLTEYLMIDKDRPIEPVPARGRELPATLTLARTFNELRH